MQNLLIITFYVAFYVTMNLIHALPECSFPVKSFTYWLNERFCRQQILDKMSVFITLHYTAQYIWHGSKLALHTITQLWTQYTHYIL